MSRISYSLPHYSLALFNAEYVVRMTGLVVVLTDVECARLSHQLWSILVSFVQSRSNYFLRALNDALITPQTPATPVSDAGFGRTNIRSEWHPAARLLLHTHVPKPEFHRCMYRTVMYCTYTSTRILSSTPAILLYSRLRSHVILYSQNYND